MTEDLLKAYGRAKSRLFLLDYDGTLVGLQPTPPEAVPTQRLLKVLQKLADDPSNVVVVISGRDRATLEGWLGALPIFLVAEHGFFIKQPGRSWVATAGLPEGWKEPVRAAMQESTARVPGSFVEEKDTSLVWHYRAADVSVAANEIAQLLQKLTGPAKTSPIAILRGHKNIESKLATMHKGTAAKVWLAQPFDFVLAAGDDTTDEDLFAAVPPFGHTIKIGSGQTKATRRLTDPAALLGVLESFTGL
jgi:trehalose 6-phosphate synthase/phosphatase